MFQNQRVPRNSHKKWIIIGKLTSIISHSRCSNAAIRQQLTAAYAFEHRCVCSKIFCSHHCFGWHQLTKHSTEVGPVPEEHGSKGGKAYNAYPFDIVSKAITFMPLYLNLLLLVADPIRHLLTFQPMKIIRWFTGNIKRYVWKNIKISLMLGTSVSWGCYHQCPQQRQSGNWSHQDSVLFKNSTTVNLIACLGILQRQSQVAGWLLYHLSNWKLFTKDRWIWDTTILYKEVFMSTLTQIRTPPPMIVGLEETKVSARRNGQSDRKRGGSETTTCPQWRLCLEHFSGSKDGGQSEGSEPVCSDRQFQHGESPYSKAVIMTLGLICLKVTRTLQYPYSTPRCSFCASGSGMTIQVQMSPIQAIVSSTGLYKILKPVVALSCLLCNSHRW